LKWLAVIGVASSHFLLAQDLAPRAYVIAPTQINAVTLTWALYNGGLNLSGAIPIDTSGTYNVSIFSYYHSLSFFGRSANITGSLPYSVGTFEAAALGRERTVYRSGLLDLGVRFSVNLKGGPAMSAEQFSRWKQKTILGASIRVIAPTGQYSETQLINWGINRWAFKPEIGCSRRWGNVLLDGYAGVWFYTTNPAHFSIPKPKPETQEPIGSFEGHLSYDFQRFGWLKGLRGWASLDGNLWLGGVTSLNGVRNVATRQTSSRLGATISLPYTKHQSIKMSYSDGVYIRFGGNYQNVSVAWQYSWLGRP
jgi:hypothetical protein